MKTLIAALVVVGTVVYLGLSLGHKVTAATQAREAAITAALGEK